MTSDDSRRAAALAQPAGQAEKLRRIALHQETAALLRQRAERAPTPEAASSQRRRAAEHADQAQQLRGELTSRRPAARPRVGSGRASTDG